MNKPKTNRRSKYFINAYQQGFKMSKEKNVFNDEMSLRDWFAGQALSYIGVIQKMSTLAGKAIKAKKLSEMCYEIADALIKERKRIVNRKGKQ